MKLKALVLFTIFKVVVSVFLWVSLYSPVEVNRVAYEYGIGRCDKISKPVPKIVAISMPVIVATNKAKDVNLNDKKNKKDNTIKIKNIFPQRNK